MAVDDMLDSKVGIAAAAAAVTATIFSPRTREVLHRGAVLGLAGALTAGDAIAAFARGVRRGASEARSRIAGADGADETEAPSRRRAAGTKTRARTGRSRTRRTRQEAPGD